MSKPKEGTSWFRNGYIRSGISRAVYDCMKADPSIYIFGEGAHMKVHFDAAYIEADFANRVVTLPISEDGNTNFAIGTSLMGVKPIVDIITADFMYRPLDAIANTAAKADYVSDKKRTVVIRGEFMTFGPTTGQRPEAIFTHIPGLNVVVPSTEKDANGLMKTALTQPGVTVFFEDREVRDADMKEEDRGDSEPIPFGVARWVQTGEQLTILSYALSLQRCQKAIAGVTNIDLIDLRTLYPIDYTAIFQSINKTGRLLIVEPDVLFGGIGAEIAATVASMCYGTLRAPIIRMGGPRSTISSSPALHEGVMPTEEQIKAVIRMMLGGAT